MLSQTYQSQNVGDLEYLAFKIMYFTFNSELMRRLVLAQQYFVKTSVTKNSQKLMRSGYKKTNIF